jgi:nicotinamidase-related amidase
VTWSYIRINALKLRARWFVQAEFPMTSLPVRDQVSDQLLTPKNAALLIIDFQPTQFGDIVSMDRQLLADNIVRMARIGKVFGPPIVLSTVNVKTRFLKPTIPPLKVVLSDLTELDRTSINAWEDKEFLAAVKATGRKKLIICALWTEACLTFPSLDALREGYEVYPVADAVGGTSLEAHQYALQRIAQAGAKIVTWVQVLCELQRDWIRTDTIEGIGKIAFDPNSPLVKNQQRPWDLKDIPVP